MYIDVYFVINVVMDRCALECALGRLGLSKGRLWLGALIGAAGACAWEVWVPEELLQPVGALSLSMLMMYVCIGTRPWRQWCSLLLQLYVYSFLFAGVIPYVSRYIPLWVGSVLFSFGGIKLWLWRQEKGKKQWMPVRIESDGQNWEGRGMVDTGHMLKEPITGKPVIIVKETSLPKEWKAEWPIVYQSVQGKGLMFGFWPRRLWIGEQAFKEREIMVAVATEWKEDEFLAIVPGYLME